MDGRGDPPLGSARRQPPPHASVTRETSEDPPHPIQSLLSPRAPIDSKSGLRLLLLIPDGSGESVEEEEEDEESEVPSAASAGYTSSTSYYFIPPDAIAAAVTPGFIRKMIEWAGKHGLPFFHPTPPGPPPKPPVPPPLFSVIQDSYRSVADSVKGAAAYVKNLAESAIKNGQSIKVLEHRLDNMEEKMAESIMIAKASLEMAKESKAMQQEVYNLVKKQVDHLSFEASEGKLARLRKAVEKPGNLFAIVGALLTYYKVLKGLKEVIEENFGKVPEEAEEVHQQMEEMIMVMERIEVKESNYSLIGSFCRGLLNDLYSSDVFSAEAQDDDMSIVSRLKRPEGGSANEVNLEYVLSDLDIKFVTDMETNGKVSLSGDIHEGLKETLAFSFPTKNTELGLTYQHVHGGWSAVVGSRPTKTLNFSCIFGLKAFMVGADLAIDGSTRSISKCDCAAGYADAKYSGSVAIANKCDLVRASIAQYIWPGTSVGAEGSYNISTGKKTMWLGVSHQLTDALLVKAKVSGDLDAAAALQYKWKECSSVSVTCQMKYSEAPRFGIHFSIKPC